MNKGPLVVAALWLSPALLWSAPSEKTEESYVKKADQEIQQWGAKVEELQKEAQGAGSKTRAEIDEDIQLLRQKLDVARQKLTELKGSGESGWKRFRRGTDRAIQDVKNAYHKTLSLLKKNEKKEGP